MVGEGDSTGVGGIHSLEDRPWDRKADGAGGGEREGEGQWVGSHRVPGGNSAVQGGEWDSLPVPRGPQGCPWSSTQSWATWSVSW